MFVEVCATGAILRRVRSGEIVDPSLVWIHAAITLAVIGLGCYGHYVA